MVIWDIFPELAAKYSDLNLFVLKILRHREINEMRAKCAHLICILFPWISESCPHSWWTLRFLFFRLGRGKGESEA